MSDKRKVELEFSVDSSGAEQAIDRIEAKTDSMAQSVSQAGQQAGKGLDAVGAGGDQAAQKLDRSTKNIIASIQRTTAAMEAGGKTNSQYFEAIASQRGLNVDALRPYLSQLDAAIAKNTDMNKSVHGTTISAKQLEQALRGVPAQFTDIFTSIAAGQNPLQVFLQQGGQLKDMFGGAGSAARALGGYVVGLINPFTVAAAAAGALAVAYYQGSKEADAYAKALIMTGNAAGATSAQMQDMAERIGGSVGTQAQAAQALAEMAGTGRIAAGNMEYFGEVAVKAEKALGISTAKMAEDLASLGKAPLASSEKLNEQYRYLTSSVYAQIKALEDQGRAEEAAAVAQRAFADAMGQRSDQIVENLGYIEAAYRSSKDTVAGWWDAVLGAGRKKSLADQIKEQKEFIEALNSGEQNGNVAVALQYLKTLEDRATAERTVAEETGKTQQQEIARIAWMKEGEKHLSRSAQMEREVTKARNEGAAAGASVAEIEARVASIREKYAEKTKAASGKATDDTRKLIEAGYELAASLLAQEFGLSGDFLKKWDSLSLAYKAGAINLDRLTEAQAALLKQQPAIRANEDAIAKAAKQRADALNAIVETEVSRAHALGVSAEKMQEELATLGMGAIELAAYRAAKLEAAAAAEELAASNLEEAAATAEAAGGNDDAVAHYRELAKARREAAAALNQQAGLTLEAAQKQASIDAAKAADTEWQRTADSIEQSLTDALMRGFESGEGFGENFKRTLINMFKTLVLRPIIQPIAQGMAGAVMGPMGNTALGLAGMGGVGGGGGFNMPTTGIGSSGLINGIAGSSLLAGTSAGAFGAGVASGLASWTTAGATVGATAGAGAAAGGAVGAGMMVGTAIPIVGIVLAILAAIDWGGGTPHAGAVVFSDENGDTTSPRTLEEARAQYANPEDVAGFTYSDYFRRREQGVADALEPIASGAATLINDTLEAFGQQAGYRVGVSFSSDRDDPSRGAFSLIDSAGGEVTEFARKYARKAEDAIPQLVGDIGVELRDFLVEQLPDWADDMLNALGDKPSMEALSATVAQVTAIRDAAEELNPIFGTTAESFIAIANKAGGIDQALQALNAYADLSMSSSEKWRAAQDALGGAFDRIDQTVPQSTAEFERMMRGIDQTTEAGQTLYASMLGLAPAFYSIAGAVEAAFESISKSAAQIVNDFAYDVMNDEQRYAFLDATLDAKLAEIREATEPGEINRLVEEAFATQRSAWQLLSEDERRRLLPEFQNDALEIEAIGQSRLSVMPVDSPEAQQAREAADERSAQRMQQAVADGITQGFAPVIAAMQQGNIDQSEALGMVAETIASLPGRIQIVTSEVGMI